MHIIKMTRAAHDLAKVKGWWRKEEKGDTGALDAELVIAAIPEKIALIHSEISEALEEYRADRLETYWEIPEYGPVTVSDITEMDFTQLGVLANAIIKTTDDSELPEFFNSPTWRDEDAADLFDMKDATYAYIISTYKPEGFDIEMADTVIRIGDLLEALNLDLTYAIKRKHAYNETRPYRHGGKKC